MDVSTDGVIALGVGLTIASAAFATAIAQKAIGSAAMGVLAEKPEESGKALLFLVIPETIVILGFVIAYLLIQKIGA